MTIHATVQPFAAASGLGAAAGGAAFPVTFSRTVGLYMPPKAGAASCNIAVLLVSPWGYEEMCVRKLWRMLAEDLAAAGIASLRFDYPGTGDALDVAAGLDLWRASILDAAAQLRTLSGVGDLILVGHGLGAALACEASAAIGDVEGVALLAPVIAGRAYLRELSVWSRMVRGAAETGDGLTVAGVTMPEAIAADIKQVNLSKHEAAPARHCFVATRADRPGDGELGARFQAAGASVETVSYEGYDQLVGNLVFSRPPLAVIEAVVNWVKWVEAAKPQSPSLPVKIPAKPEPLHGETFRETPLRFGDNGRLLGILCEPADGQRTGATVIMLTTAYERMSGWGRVATETARKLAAAGIASLRFDAANAADSPPVAGAPQQIIYSDAQYDDVDAAVDLIIHRGLGPVVIAGRCSGGYLAVRAAARDVRIRGAVSANPYAFFWDGSHSIEELLQFVPQQLSTYGVKIFRADTWRRIASGQVNLKYAVINTLRSLRKRSLKFAGPLFEAIPSLSRERREVFHVFQSMLAHGTELSLLYSQADVGLNHFSFHFGNDGAGLTRYPNARFMIVPDADHDLTTPHFRALYQQEIEAVAVKCFPEGREA
ncbi:alpha/beta fold hydrolase [Rhizobium sp. LjRoot30]|uniref:alpha/beta fold hydrolase n=1 Tax=Rhizobium sp. LjRoot30 TaxID=3342320 RepID=UPI003ECFC672